MRKRNNQNKAKGFLKSKKGAEIIEIVIGVVIALAIVAIAVPFITKAVKNATGGKDVNGNDIITTTDNDNNNSAPIHFNGYFIEGNTLTN